MNAHPLGSDGSHGSRTDAVIAWNANAGKAALAACIALTDNPLLGAIPNGRAKTRGVEVGQAAAAAILALRAADGSDTPLQDFLDPQGTGLGVYRFTQGSRSLSRQGGPM